MDTNSTLLFAMPNKAMLYRKFIVHCVDCKSGVKQLVDLFKLIKHMSIDYCYALKIATHLKYLSRANSN